MTSGEEDLQKQAKKHRAIKKWSGHWRQGRGLEIEMAWWRKHKTLRYKWSHHKVAQSENRPRIMRKAPKKFVTKKPLCRLRKPFSWETNKHFVFCRGLSLLWCFCSVSFGSGGECLPCMWPVNQWAVGWEQPESAFPSFFNAPPPISHSQLIWRAWPSPSCLHPPA